MWANCSKVVTIRLISLPVASYFDCHACCGFAAFLPGCLEIFSGDILQDIAVLMANDFSKVQ